MCDHLILLKYQRHIHMLLGYWLCYCYACCQDEWPEHMDVFIFINSMDYDEDANFPPLGSGKDKFNNGIKGGLKCCSIQKF